MQYILDAAHRGTHPIVDWKAGAWAGVIAGIVFLVLEMMLVALVQGESPWGPPRMMAAIVLGRGVLPPPADFDPGIMAAAMLVHLVLSIIYGIGFGALVHRLTPSAATFLGAGLGLALYLVNFYGFTAVFPWFAMARGSLGAFAHIVFGAVAGFAYAKLAHPSTTHP